MSRNTKLWFFPLVKWTDHFDWFYFKLVDFCHWRVQMCLKKTQALYDSNVTQNMHDLSSWVNNRITERRWPQNKFDLICRFIFIFVNNSNTEFSQALVTKHSTSSVI